jgi:hypothetical protein
METGSVSDVGVRRSERSAPRDNAIAEALWYVGPGRAELRSEELEAPHCNELRVRALFGAISRGTESLVFAGRVPKSEFRRMRGPHMGGDFPFPVKYGYSLVGVVEIGEASLIGQTVFVLHPHQTRFNAQVGAAILLPDGLPPRRAVLAANMETALNGVWDGAPGPADRIAVVGCGVVGALVAFLCGRIAGTEVTIIDTNPARVETASRLGVAFADPRAAPSDCDLVFHASGTEAGLASALGCAGEEATIIDLSWYGAGQIAAPLGGAFHSRRLRLISSQVGQVAASRRPRWTRERRLASSLALLMDARLDALIEPAIPFRDLPERLPDILRADSGVLCQLIEHQLGGFLVRRRSP